MIVTNENHKGIQQIDFVIRGEDYKNDGKMKWMVLNDNIFVGYIDIYSRFLPKSIFTTFSTINEGKTPIKINYCFRGRCEVKLGSGATTFVVGDELAIDYGTANNDEEAFFYPSSEYEGIEIIIFPAKEMGKELTELGGAKTIKGITSKFSDRTIPLITVSDNRIKRCMEDIREDILNFTDEKLLETDVIKILLLLKGVSFDADKRRTFCTGSQVDIAKKAFEMVNGDLSKRYSASELASVFGVSESSLKNYIRVVFGRGYKELVNETRMKKAADLIINSEKSMGEIAESVGYQNQSRFSEAFLKYHKVLPMEYKRMHYVAKKDKNTILL